MNRENILKALRAQININGHIIGVSTGSGVTAKYAVKGGADFILALSAGKFRMMGRSSLASFLCYGNSNDIVMQLGMTEILPLVKDTPVLFGINPNDPSKNLYDYIKQIKNNGFSGINNFPSIGLFDGQFREALEEEGISFQTEVEAIRIANFLDMFTVAFVFNENQAIEMVKAGADILCVHLGLTEGGFLGAKKSFSIEHAKLVTDKIFSAIKKEDHKPIKMVYGGPASKPIDLAYLYGNTDIEGYIGGSSFERIPVENAILESTRAFKSYRDNVEDPLINHMNDSSKKYDYADFVKKYIDSNYSKVIRISELALVLHISESYLSKKFKKDVGCSFSEYLVKYRISKASSIIKEEDIPLKKVAEMVGYFDYSQFSKMFKKYKGISPNQYLKTYKHK